MSNSRLITRDFFDTPEVLDCAVTPIPGSGSAPLQVIASMAHAIYAIRSFDGIGQYVGVYKGAAGKEKLIAIIGGGSPNKVETYIALGERISLRSMNPATFTTGSLCCHFLSA